MARRWVLAIAALTAPTGCVEPDAVAGTDASTSAATTTSSGPTGANDTGTTVPQSPACADYLACLGDVAPDEVAQATGEIGPDGTCWVDAGTAAACDAECSEQLGLRCGSGSGSGSETGEPPLRCSIEGLLPGTPSPIVAGAAAEQLPLEVGDVLERNCGCHYLAAAELDRTVPAYQGTIALATWQDFHAPFGAMLTWQHVQQRAVTELSMPPSFFCDSLALGSLSAEDHALLEAWLASGAPDGASWP